MTSQNQANPNDEVPPLFGSWSRIYGFVLVLHFILIVLFYFVSQAYA
jgi:hypothetical protein